MARRATLLLSLLALMIGSTACRRRAAPDASSEPDQAVLDRFGDALRRGIAGATVSSGTDGFLVKMPDGTTNVAYYDGVLRQCATAPASCDEAIAISVRTLGQVTGADAQAPRDPSQVNATVKDEAYVRMLDGMDAGGPHLERHLVADLWILVTEESPDHRLYLGRESLTTYGKTEDGMFALAFANIEATFPALAPKPYAPGSPVRYLVDDMAPSWMLLPARWKGVADSVRGDLLASVPDGSTVLLTGSGESGGRDELRKLTLDFESTHPHPVSRTLLRWTSSGWVVDGG